MPNAYLPSDANSAHILVAITFHYDAGRLGYLADVMRTLSEFPVPVLDVVIVTNSFDDAQLAMLRSLCAETFTDDRCKVLSAGDLASPLDLTWRHKPIIVDEFLGDGSGRYTHFIYLEADIRLTFANFCSWVQFRELTRAYGLLPSFLRLEWSASAGSSVMSDVFWPVYVPAQSHLLLGDVVLVSMPNPYNPCFILDVELAHEYVRSPSFDIDASKSVVPWGTAERAAAGLCLEQVPPAFPSRYVVPVSRRTGKAPVAGWISHLPNNYADHPRSPLGKLRVADLFHGIDELKGAKCWGAESAADERLDAEHMPWSGMHRKQLENYYYLISEHDTILYASDEVQRVRHAPFGVAPLNLILDWAGSRGRLMGINATSRNVCPLSFVSSDGEINERPDTTDYDCEIAYYADGTVSIRVDGMYLGAELGGLAVNNKTWCHQWERYRLVRADLIEALTLMREHSWVSHDDRRIVSLADQPFDFGRAQPTEASALASTLAPGALDTRRTLAFGPARLRLTDWNHPVGIDEPAHRGDLPGRLSIENPDGVKHHFSRFAPLVRYAVEGTDAAHERLQLSLASLARHGRYRGAICVACDRAREELLAYVPTIFHDSLIVQPIPEARAASEADDLNSNLFGRYQPVLSCSPDTIFTGSIVDLLIDRLVTGQVTGSLEFAVPASAEPHLGEQEPASEADHIAWLARRAPPGSCVVVLGDLGESDAAFVENVQHRATVYWIAAGPSASQLPNLIQLQGDSPREFLGWQREIDVLMYGGLSANPELRMNLQFWSGFVRPGGIVCGPGYDSSASDVRSEVNLLAVQMGAPVDALGDTWLIEQPDRDA